MSFHIRIHVLSIWWTAKKFMQPRTKFVDSEKYYGICVKPNSRINSIFGARHARKKIFIIHIGNAYVRTMSHTLPMTYILQPNKQREGKTPNRTNKKKSHLSDICVYCVYVYDVCVCVKYGLYAILCIMTILIHTRCLLFLSVLFPFFRNLPNRSNSSTKYTPNKMYFPSTFNDNPL